jgi:hypothetical protein
MGLVEWLKVNALTSNLSTAEKRKIVVLEVHCDIHDIS